MSEATRPQSAGNPLAQAQALIDVGRFDDAIARIRQAIGADPDNELAYCLLALAFLHKDDTARALDAAQRAILLAPENEWPHRLRSIILLRRGDKRGALESAREAARLAPDLPETLTTLARAELDNRETAAARQTTERALTLAPERSGTHALLGNIALAEKAWLEADRHYLRALALDPREWEALNNRGVALQHLGRDQEAIESFHEAARVDPTNELTQRNLRGAVGRHLAPYRVSRPVMWALIGLAVLFPPLRLALILVRVANYVVVRPYKLRALHPTVVAFYKSQRRPGQRLLFILLCILSALLVISLLALWLGTR